MAEALVVIGGSTASGKSALALTLAEASGGVVVNADSQQLFADLPTLTARPTTADEARAPHRLYGLLAADEQPSVGRWLALVEAELAGARAAGRPAIVTGGTGLYLHAVLHGLPAMPSIPADLRAGLRAWGAAAPAEEIHARLRRVDPAMAGRLQPGDRQRVLRALEVATATGRSLADWQTAPRWRDGLPATSVGVALVPPAAVVNPRIEARLEAMLAAGAVDEARHLLRRRPDFLSLPIAKVHGLRELAAVAEGRLRLEEARSAIAAQVRRYAKRQRTWFRHQLPELRPIMVPGEDPEALRVVADLLRA